MRCAACLVHCCDRHCLAVPADRGVLLRLITGRYVDAERTAVGLQLMNVCVVRPHPEHGFAEPEVVQVVGTDEDICARQELRDQLFKSNHSFLHSVPRFEEATTA